MMTTTPNPNNTPTWLAKQVQATHEPVPAGCFGLAWRENKSFLYPEGQYIDAKNTSKCWWINTQGIVLDIAPQAQCLHKGVRLELTPIKSSTGAWRNTEWLANWLNGLPEVVSADVVHDFLSYSQDQYIKWLTPPPCAQPADFIAMQAAINKVLPHAMGLQCKNIQAVYLSPNQPITAPNTAEQGATSNASKINTQKSKPAYTERRFFLELPALRNQLQCCTTNDTDFEKLWNLRMQSNALVAGRSSRIPTLPQTAQQQSNAWANYVLHHSSRATTGLDDCWLILNKPTNTTTKTVQKQHLSTAELAQLDSAMNQITQALDACYTPWWEADL